MTDIVRPPPPPVDRTRPEPGSEGPHPLFVLSSPPDLDAGPAVYRAPLVAEAAPAPRTVEAVLAFFVTNDGLGEYPDGSNDNWITQRCGLGAVAWCVEAQSLALLAGGFGSFDAMVMDIGLPTTYRWGWAYVPTVRRVFADAGRWGTTPVVGALVVMFDNGHIGWCEEDLGDGTILTREGNASNRLGQFRRSLVDVDGFCTIPYEEEDDMFTDDDRKLLAEVHAYNSEEKGGAVDTIEEAIAGVVNRIEAKVDALKAGGGPVEDLDALADKLADKLADRLAERLRT